VSDGLPEGWAEAPLSDLLEPGGLFDGPFGSNLKTGDYSDTGVRVVRLENIANLRFVGDKVTYISDAKYHDLARHTIGAGDIIVGSFVDGAVRVCILPELPTKAIATREPRERQGRQPR
jgi:type I restriction enzyme S subunit